MKNRIEKSLLGVTGEYYVAAELGKRNIYAQLTLGNQKRTDLLIFSENADKLLKVEVKCKQADSWPNCKGINSKNAFIIFVDFQRLAPDERPTFYILDNEDWTLLVRKMERFYRKKHPNRRTKIEKNVLILLDEVNKNGQPYRGCGVKVMDIGNFKEAWNKITDRMK